MIKEIDMNKNLKIIYEKIIEKDIFENSYYKQYLKEYIVDKYQNILNSFEKEKSENELTEIVQMWNEDEINFFENLSEEELKVVLLPDKALKELEEISFQIFELAKNCKKKSYRLSDSEYEEWLKKISDPLDNIKEHNIPYAKELISEAILDIEYAYGKTNNMSFRLAKVV